MKKNLYLLSFLICSLGFAQDIVWEYKVITSVESIVPSGLGRSRIIEANQEIDYNDFTSQRTEGNKNSNKSKRSQAKIDNLKETKLLNFYSLAGINFQNIASNDALISSKLNEMSQQGWELLNIVSGVESDAGEKDGKGIFITRYIFKRASEK